MKKRNLFQKFTIVIVVMGLVPMMILSRFITNYIMEEYKETLRVQYEQAANYLNASLEAALDGYNTLSKISYSYRKYTDADIWSDYYSFDRLRQILQDTEGEPELRAAVREKEMEVFLSSINSADGRIEGVHFIGVDADGEKIDFHYSYKSTYIKDPQLFETMVRYQEWDRESNKLQLIPTHETGYFALLDSPVFTIARNYFDLRGAVGNTPYVGTLFLDISTERMADLFEMVELNGNESFQVLDGEDHIYYSTTLPETDDTGTDQENGNDRLIIRTNSNPYGLSVEVTVNTSTVFERIRRIQRMMYLFLLGSILALFAGSVVFSRKLTRPIYEMMNQMEEIENGNFDIQLPVSSEDEIGVLSRRFNQMSAALKTYINHSYVLQIRQTEAELTALKSQIYPHFLYNTLEVIRMTAVDEGGERVPKMIEALSEQIHYLIGPMQDMVSLSQEISIVKKYVYLLNCRIEGKVQLALNVKNAEKIRVPKLILQPIVENAYVHGIKPRKGSGSILIETEDDGTNLIINVMDSGIGMSEEGVQKIRNLLEGDAPGIKNEVNWQSIGLKNVHDRLKYLYGEEYGISISSTEKVGTMVRLVMPSQAGGSEEGEENT